MIVPVDGTFRAMFWQWENRGLSRSPRMAKPWGEGCTRVCKPERDIAT